MIKLFVSDMDGTLLNSKHTISDTNAQSIKELQNSGIEFMIATGRTFASSKALLEMQGIECEIINLNGAAVYDSKGNIIESIPLEKNVARSLIEYCNNYHIDYSVMTEHKIYVSDKETFLKKMNDFFNLTGAEDDSTTPQFIGEFAHTLDIKEFDFESDEHILKMVVMSEKDSVLKSLRKLFENDGSLDITSSNHDNLEITHIQAQKGFAIQTYINQKGWSMDEVVAIGDSLNDRSMLKMAGYGFAMENASDEVKHFTRYRAPHCDDDGVSQIIQDILAGKYDE